MRESECLLTVSSFLLDLTRSCCPPPLSIWTVDLAHLLRRFGLEVCFLTTTLGPNPAYVNESFYMEHIQVLV